MAERLPFRGGACRCGWERSGASAWSSTPYNFLPAKVRRDTALTDGNRVDMDLTFTTTLLPTSLALLALRAMPAMNLLLAEDLGTAFPRFITMPYGKLMRGLYRVVWLVLDDHEMIQMRAGAG